MVLLKLGMLVEVALIQNKLEVVVGSALTIKVSNTENFLCHRISHYK